jgi:hypothetical protein
MTNDNGNGHHRRYRMVYLDRFALTAIGISTSDPDDVRLFFLGYPHNAIERPEQEPAYGDARLLGNVLSLLAVYTWPDQNEPPARMEHEIDGRPYESLPLTDALGRAIMPLVDGLVSFRLRQGSAIELKVQLEMPL